MESFSSFNGAGGNGVVFAVSPFCAISGMTFGGLHCAGQFSCAHAYGTGLDFFFELRRTPMGRLHSHHRHHVVPPQPDRMEIECIQEIFQIPSRDGRFVYEGEGGEGANVI